MEDEAEVEGRWRKHMRISLCSSWLEFMEQFYGYLLMSFFKFSAVHLKHFLCTPPPTPAPSHVSCVSGVATLLSPAWVPHVDLPHSSLILPAVQLLFTPSNDGVLMSDISYLGLTSVFFIISLWDLPSSHIIYLLLQKERGGGREREEGGEGVKREKSEFFFC